ncbi:MAG TPA: hypothetical protein VIL20_04610 [Sandaracinaceae bacterium]
MLAVSAIAWSAVLGGCEGCGEERRVRAQALDAGVVAAPVLPSPSAPAICYVAASEQTELLDDQIFALCQGAPTATGPVECYVAAARRLMLTDAQRVALCRCAPSAEPVDCVEMLERETRLLQREIEQLCAPTLSRGLLANCIPRTA